MIDSTNTMYSPEVCPVCMGARYIGKSPCGFCLASSNTSNTNSARAHKAIIPGHWEHLAELSKIDYNGSPLEEFAYWFTKYHNCCILSKWTTSKDTYEPYIYVQLLGAFTDLNTLARRIQNELHEENKQGKLEFKKPTVDFFSETLHFTLVNEEFYRTELQVEFLQLNLTEKIYTEGWKFKI